MNNVKIFTNLIEDGAVEQLKTLTNLPAFKDCKIRIMPDVHAGSGCVIGFTANLGDKVIPNIVGVDIGCGMRVIELGKVDLDFAEVDRVIKERVPAGFSVHKKPRAFNLEELYCYNELRNRERVKASIGTLGGGNHFIEIDRDEDDNKYIIIHTGSRNLGKQVADIYQKLAIDKMPTKEAYDERVKQTIKELKEKGLEQEINKTIKEMTYVPIPKDLCYLENEDRLKYLHDMKICQEFAVLNRENIGKAICEDLGIEPIDTFESVHNYISFEDNIVRKGAISARKGERLLIPLNMRDGCILGIGKGNDDWNNSAPHGAGRLMSRTQAKQEISLEKFQRSMEGIYSTTVNKSTIDEAPFAYKPIESIVNNIKDTVEIKKILKPIYNFKASD